MYVLLALSAVYIFAICNRHVTLVERVCRGVHSSILESEANIDAAHFHVTLSYNFEES